MLFCWSLVILLPSFVTDLLVSDYNDFTHVSRLKYREKKISFPIVMSLYLPTSGTKILQSTHTPSEVQKWWDFSVVHKSINIPWSSALRPFSRSRYLSLTILSILLREALDIWVHLFLLGWRSHEKRSSEIRCLVLYVMTCLILYLLKPHLEIS